MDNNLERWYSMKEIMEYLGVSRDTVLDWIERREMPAAKIGRCDGFPGEVFHPGIRFEYSFQKRYGIVGDDFHDGIRIG